MPECWTSLPNACAITSNRCADFRYDTVRAVVAAGADQPADAQARAEAMEALRGGEDFEALSAAAKRIRNILAKSATAADWQAGELWRSF